MKPVFDTLAGKSKDDLWYRHWRLQHLILLYRLMDHRPDVIDKKFHKELTVTDEYYYSLEREYLRLCLALNMPNTLVNRTYPGIEISNRNAIRPGSGLHKPGVRMLLEKYGTKEAISEYPWGKK